jgi:hypothetical protein
MANHSAVSSTDCHVQRNHLRKIGNVDKRVVERGEDASNAENELSLAGLRSELDILLDSNGLGLWCHDCWIGLVVGRGGGWSRCVH